MLAETFRARVAGLALLALAVPARAEKPPEPTLVFADVDDDDDDGVPDGEDAAPSGRSANDVLWLPEPREGVGKVETPLARLLAGERPFAGGSKPRGRLGLQGLGAGLAEITLDGAPLAFWIVEVAALDGRG
ncbi:MAG TPA: hypothetical protein VGK73_02185, partial [Polyangiaceae bacterium]